MGALYTKDEEFDRHTEVIRNAIIRETQDIRVELEEWAQDRFEKSSNVTLIEALLEAGIDRYLDFLDEGEVTRSLAKTVAEREQIRKSKIGGANRYGAVKQTN